MSGSAPVGVISSVCSNWAERRPSLVAAVQSSFHMTCRKLPSQIIGSIVKTWPTCTSDGGGKRR